MFYLKLLEFPVKGIVLGVGKLGAIHDVVEVIVPFDLSSKSCDFLGRWQSHDENRVVKKRAGVKGIAWPFRNKWLLCFVILCFEQIARQRLHRIHPEARCAQEPEGTLLFEEGLCRRMLCIDSGKSLFP